jgi:hypothetical protein
MTLFPPPFDCARAHVRARTQVCHGHAESDQACTAAPAPTALTSRAHQGAPHSSACRLGCAVLRADHGQEYGCSDGGSSSSTLGEPWLISRLSYYRSQLERKNKTRADAEKKVGEYRRKEADKRAAAAKARASAAKSKNASTVQSKLPEADRYEDQANTAARDAASWSTKAAKYAGQHAYRQETPGHHPAPPIRCTSGRTSRTGCMRPGISLTVWCGPELGFHGVRARLSGLAFVMRAPMVKALRWCGAP